MRLAENEVRRFRLVNSYGDELHGKSLLPSCTQSSPCQHFTKFVQPQHSHREGDDQEPNRSRQSGCGEEPVSQRRVVDKQNEHEFEEYPRQNQSVAEGAERERRRPVTAAEEDVRYLHDNDGAETRRGGLPVKGIAGW